MIRILHTSDWHLGKRLERFSRHEEQVEVLEEICQLADSEGADVVVVAGDLFDTFNPPAESLDLFYRALKTLAKNGQRPVIAIAGNHDMPERIEAPDPLARECGILFAGFPDSSLPLYSLGDSFRVTRSEAGFLELQLPGKPLLRVLITPYANEIRLRKGLNPDHSEEDLRLTLQAHWSRLTEKYCHEPGVNILAAHLLFMPEDGEAPEEPDDERPINHIGGTQSLFTSSIPGEIQYVALGHLHRYQHIPGAACPVIYSGSPLSYSFSEAGQQKQVVIIEAEPGRPAIVRPVALHKGRRLERRKFESIESAVTWLGENPEVLVELTLVSDTFLSGEDRRHLHEAHNGIVTIIPEIREGASGPSEPRKELPLTENMPELFREYFRTRNGQEAGQAIMDLFMEINAEEEGS